MLTCDTLGSSQTKSRKTEHAIDVVHVKMDEVIIIAVTIITIDMPEGMETVTTKFRCLFCFFF